VVTCALERMTGACADVHKRVLSELLSALDGIQTRSQVLFLAATNRPADLDQALLRPGRLDRLVYVPAPDVEARVAILRVLTAQMAIGPDVDAAELAARTERFTGADLKGLCREAGLAALGESFEIPFVSRRHFDEALETTRASPEPDEELMASYMRLRRGIGVA
jgi:transitional endoplasmic reticulum ATPase